MPVLAIDAGTTGVTALVDARYNLARWRVMESARKGAA